MGLKLRRRRAEPAGGWGGASEGVRRGSLAAPSRVRLFNHFLRFGIGRGEGVLGLCKVRNFEGVCEKEVEE